MNENGFKTYERGRRIQTIDESFAEGQVFTRAPLAAKRVRALVNYDIINEGEAITNRKGLRASMLGIPNSELAPSFNEHASIQLGVDTIKEDSKHYRLLIADQFLPTDAPIEGSNLYQCKSDFWVLDTSEGAWHSDCLEEYEVDLRGFYSIAASYEIPDPQPFSTTTQYQVGDLCVYDNTTYRCIKACKGAWNASNWNVYVAPNGYYYVPSDAEAHGMKLTHTELLGRGVGTFAFNNDYYSFNTYGELVRTKYRPADKVPAAYDSTSTYAQGDLCEHGGTYWKCNTNITVPEAWTSSKWDAYTLLNATFLTEHLKPKEVTVAEAALYGNNMLSEKPYEFYDKYQAGAIVIHGISLMQNNQMVLQPMLNLPYKLRMYYEAQQNDTYKIIWDYREVGSEEFTQLQSQEYNLNTTTPPEVYVPSFSSPATDIVIRVRAYKKASGSYPEDPTKEFSVGVVYAKIQTSTFANRDLVNYDLSKATGMAYWQGHLWLYGLAQDPTVLFWSDVNEPSYFPYPSNSKAFDEPVLSLVVFNDSLLVFTQSQMWQVTRSDEGAMSFKVLQGNLNFTEFNVRFVQVVKNMVFFKSGDYYYMIVPKTLSLKNEYALAPVSKNIEYLLDEFMDNTTELFKNLYEYSGSLELIDHYNYLSYEDVHNVYVFKTDTGIYLNLVLLYNTVDRNWRMYTYESETVYHPFRQDATKPGELMTPAYPKIVVAGSETQLIGVEFLEYHRTEIRDFYIPAGSKLYSIGSGNLQPDNGAIKEHFDDIHKYKNFQMLDSGYRDHLLDYNKRYRELQFKFNNISSSLIQFFTEFILDGDTRVSRFKYETEHITDPTQPNFGLIYINRTPIENLELPGTTRLAEDEQDLNSWTLDSSRFPEVAFWKARLKVSGKGYTPRFRLLCRTEERYELLGFTWVYRQMYSR